MSKLFQLSGWIKFQNTSSKQSNVISKNKNKSFTNITAIWLYPSETKCPLFEGANRCKKMMWIMIKIITIKPSTKCITANLLIPNEVKITSPKIEKIAVLASMGITEIKFKIILLLRNSYYQLLRRTQ